MAPLKAAAANVESVFSGAGKFSDEVSVDARDPHVEPAPCLTVVRASPCLTVPQAKSVGPAILKRMVKLHYNWKYVFLRPSIEKIVKRYKLKFHNVHAASTAAPAPAAPPAAAAAAQ